MIVQAPRNDEQKGFHAGIRRNKPMNWQALVSWWIKSKSSLFICLLFLLSSWACRRRGRGEAYPPRRRSRRWYV